MMFNFPDSCSSQDWARLKPGAKNYTRHPIPVAGIQVLELLPLSGHISRKLDQEHQELQLALRGSMLVFLAAA